MYVGVYLLAVVKNITFEVHPGGCIIFRVLRVCDTIILLVTTSTHCFYLYFVLSASCAVSMDLRIHGLDGVDDSM